MKDTVNEIMIKKTLPSLLLVMLIFILDRASKYFILELSGPMGQLNILKNLIKFFLKLSR